MRTTAITAAAIIGGCLFTDAFTQYDPGYPNQIVTGKHHTSEDIDCSGDECIAVPARWQLDILSGRSANTIDVDEQTYDRYAVGDAYRG